MTIANTQERFSSYSHLLGALISVAGTIFLCACAATRGMSPTTVLIYGLSLVFLFSASSVYHARKTEENGTSVYRKLDHFAIFILIAGTYTPMCVFYLNGGWRMGIILAQWSLVFAGMFITFFYINAPRALTTAIYLVMGWLALLPLRQLWGAMTSHTLFLLFGGGAAYTIGAIIYALKKPNPLPGKFGFHEIFHVFILVGAGMHYAMILESVLGR